MKNSPASIAFLAHPFFRHPNLEQTQVSTILTKVWPSHLTGPQRRQRHQVPASAVSWWEVSIVILPVHVNFRVEHGIDVAIKSNKFIAWHTMRMGMPHAEKLQQKPRMDASGKFWDPCISRPKMIHWRMPIFEKHRKNNDKSWSILVVTNDDHISNFRYPKGKHVWDISRLTCELWVAENDCKGEQPPYPTHQLLQLHSTIFQMHEFPGEQAELSLVSPEYPWDTSKNARF